MFYEQSSKMIFFNRLFTAIFSRTLFIFQEWGGLSLGVLNVLDLWFSWIIDKVLYRWEKKKRKKRKERGLELALLVRHQIGTFSFLTNHL